MHKLASELEIGDEIVGSIGRVNKIEYDICGKNKVHINDDACYEWNAPVEVK